MWVVSGLLAYWLLGLPFWVGLLVGAIVTPTDTVIASTIVSGETARENIPERLRHLISAESGANDGGAYPLVFLAVLMIQHPFGRALGEWLTTTLLWEVLFAVLVGLAIGEGRRARSASVGFRSRFLPPVSPPVLAGRAASRPATVDTRTMIGSLTVGKKAAKYGYKAYGVPGAAVAGAGGAIGVAVAKKGLQAAVETDAGASADTVAEESVEIDVESEDESDGFADAAAVDR